MAKKEPCIDHTAHRRLDAQSNNIIMFQRATIDALNMLARKISRDDNEYEALRREIIAIMFSSSRPEFFPKITDIDI